MLSLYLRITASITLFAAVVGCGGDGLNLADVSGQVTLDGKPVPNATVVYTPQAEGGSPSYGTTDPEGNYNLMFSRDREGVLIGSHSVQVTTEKMDPSDVAALKAEGEEAPEFVRVPPKYAAKGELVREVEPGKNTINLELTAE